MQSFVWPRVVGGVQFEEAPAVTHAYFYRPSNAGRQVALGVPEQSTRSRGQRLRQVTHAAPHFITTQLQLQCNSVHACIRTCTQTHMYTNKFFRVLRRQPGLLESRVFMLAGGCDKRLFRRQKPALFRGGGHYSGSILCIFINGH